MLVNIDPLGLLLIKKEGVKMAVILIYLKNLHFMGKKPSTKNQEHDSEPQDDSASKNKMLRKKPWTEDEDNLVRALV